VGLPVDDDRVDDDRADVRPANAPADELSSAYRFSTVMIPAPRQYSGGHLVAVAADELIFSARNRYFDQGVRWPLIGDDFWLVYRHMTMDYFAEAFTGEVIVARGRTTTRTRRTITQHFSLWVGERRVIAAADIVLVAFDVAARRSVEVPEDLWAAIQRYESGP
jgi:acyl-CoA thioesterase FadM